jgi:GT2 family glycosyltransferase
VQSETGIGPAAPPAELMDDSSVGAFDDSAAADFMGDPLGDDTLHDTTAVSLPARRAHHVTAVLVAHNGSRWLPTALRGLRGQARSVDLTVAVDTGSTDDSADLLIEALGSSSVASAPEETSFATAIGRGLARAAELASVPAGLEPESLPPSGSVIVDSETVTWLWLLHDDCAPEPGALDALLAAADTRPDAAVIGPKVVGWHDHGLLLEVGVSITGGGRRETFLERRERDQGQHDGLKDVLSVGSAGMLIRRDVWDSLHGMDPHLGMFRDDLEFCIRVRSAGHAVITTGEALVIHAEAGAHGRRELHSVIDRPHLVDRASAIHVVLVHWPLWLLPLLVLRILAGSIGRVVAFLLGKDPLAAADEIAAVGRAIVRLGHVVEARRHTARTRRIRHSTIRPFLPTVVDAWRHALDVCNEVLELATDGRSLIENRGTRVTPVSIPAQRLPDDVEAALIDDPMQRGSLMRRLFRQPVVTLTLLLLFAAGVAERSLIGSGVLHGGALLAVPTQASDLVAHYVASWHDVGGGSALESPPYLMVLAVLSGLTFGNASSLVTLLLIAAVPLAAISAGTALRSMVSSPIVRAIAGTVYALLPPMTAAVLTGRLGTLVLGILLPWLLRAAHHLVSTLHVVAWRRVWGGALLLTLITAFVPAVWLITVVGLGVHLLRRASVRAQWPRISVLLVTPIALLAPWSMRLISEPRLWLLEPGRLTRDLVDEGTSALDVLLLSPGGHGSSWTGAAVVVAGIVALSRRATQRQVLTIWWLSLLPFALGVLQTLLVVQVPGNTDRLNAWPGPATLMLGAAAITATAMAADGLAPRLSRMSFSWRHMAAAALAIAVMSGTMLSMVLWMRTGSLITRADDSPVPEFVRSDLRSEARPRAIVLRRDADGAVAYEMVSASGPILGDADVMPVSNPAISAAVSDLAAGRGGPEMSVLAAYGVRYVVVAGKDNALVSSLDTAVGLRRLAGDFGGLWRTTVPDARLRLTADGKDLLADEGRAGPRLVIDTIRERAPYGVRVEGDLSLDVEANAQLEILLGEVDDSEWVALLDGQPLVRQISDVGSEAGTVRWLLPVGEGRVLIERDASSRSAALLIQAMLLAVVILMALPRRRAQDPEGDAELEFLSPVASR